MTTINIENVLPSPKACKTHNTPKQNLLSTTKATSNHHDSKMEEDICQFYHIHTKKLGEGGFAGVRLATHLVTGQNVAIKCLDKVKLGPELPRIYNEIECLKRLKHHNIARLYQVFETQSMIYLVLEYCSGGELFDYIVSKSKLSEMESAQIIYDLMNVLNYIHINGFAHRDLKPENVLFDDKHQIKLIDFGLAANCSADHMATNKNQAPLDQLSTCCGSVTYAAPEVISGRVYSGTSCDVWSAGVMLYALLVGRLPFNDNSISKLYQKIQDGIKTVPSFLSEEAGDLIMKMLIVDPTKRITVPEILSHPWIHKRIRPFSQINRRLESGNENELTLAVRARPFARANRRLDFSSKNELDEQLFVKCCELFPSVTVTKMRDYIRRDFNYYSTTYHLLKAKSPPRALAARIVPARIVPARIVPANIIPERHPMAEIIAKPSPSQVTKTRFIQNTPMNTPKRTLLKRLIDSATPRRLKKPREK